MLSMVLAVMKRIDERKERARLGNKNFWRYLRDRFASPITRRRNMKYLKNSDYSDLSLLSLR